MAWLGVQREVLAGMLRSHGEDDLAERALLLTDDELKRIGELGAHYAFSEQAMAMGGSMGGMRALSLATIDVLESTGRDLRWSRTERELEFGAADEWTEVDVARDRALRVHAIPEQQPPRTPEPAASRALAFIPGKAERGPQAVATRGPLAPRRLAVAPHGFARVSEPSGRAWIMRPWARY